MIQFHEITRQVRDLLREQNVSSAPVPVVEIAAALGARVRYSPFDQELSGMVYMKGRCPIIGVNSLHHPNRQRFTVAHEVAHLTLHRHLIADHVHVDKRFPVLMRDANSATGTQRMEMEANHFAAELLMPSFLLMPLLKKKAFDIDDERPLEQLSRKFRVSKQALDYRIRNIAYPKAAAYPDDRASGWK